nr:recombinase zinc beta ribbon domain-containing protein [Rubrobacter sp.]
TTHKPREEWVAVPVADPGIPREVVDAAREAIKDNKKTSSAGSRFWELSGGVARCAGCGSALTPLTVNRKNRGKVDHYYRCLGHHQRRICPNNRHYRAEELEARVAGGVWLLFRDPEKVLAHIDERIEREALRDPAEEAKVWEERIAGLDRKISRAQDLAIEGLVSKEQLRQKVEALGAKREQAKQELGALEDRRGRLEQLERDRRAMLSLYAQGLMGAFDHFPAEDRHGVYKKLKLRALAHQDGMLELAGSLDANVLPTSDGAAESHARMNREVLRKGESWSRLAYGRFGGSSPTTTTTRRSR